MSIENQIIEVTNGVADQIQKDQPWSKIDDEQVYVLNPLCRLRNSTKNYVLIRSIEGLPQDRVHRAAGIVLALCNGKSSVADIARITRPLVKIADDSKAVEIAKNKVKWIIYIMGRTLEERDGLPPKSSELPSKRLVLTRVDFDQKFSGTKYRLTEYCPTDFLPRNQSEMSTVPFLDRREAVPMRLVWLVTSDCSTDCRYCYLRRRKVKPMTKERMLSIVEEAANIGVAEINPTGGDILLYRYLQDILHKRVSS